MPTPVFPEGDIAESFNFSIRTPKPIDSRQRVATYAELADITFKYHGLQVFVMDEDQFYYFKSDLSWVPLSEALGAGANRFEEIHLISPDNESVIKMTTDGVDTFQMFSKQGDLLLRIRKAPVVMAELDIPWELDQNLPSTYLDLKLSFKKVDGSVIFQEYYAQDTGVIGDTGGIKPRVNDPIAVSVSYHGGELDEFSNVIDPWPNQVRVFVEILKNGVSFDTFEDFYAIPPAPGFLGQIEFTPDNDTDTWEVNALAEIY